MPSYKDEKLCKLTSVDESVAQKSTSHKSWLTRRFRAELADVTSVPLWRAVLAEFLGTIFLCIWTIGITLRTEAEGPPDILLIALSTGFCVAAIICMLLNASGGHINPAVSLGFLLCGKITLMRFVLFSVVQCTSSVVAVCIIQAAFPTSMHGSLGYIPPGPEASAYQVLVGEFMVTYFLLFGIAGLIEDARSDLTGLVPIYVGFIVTANILFGFGTSGGCMNPARNFGPALITGNTDLLWAYMVGPMAGSLFGTLTFNLLLSDDTVLGAGCCIQAESTSSRSGSNAGSAAEAECMMDDIREDD